MYIVLYVVIFVVGISTGMTVMHHYYLVAVWQLITVMWMITYVVARKIGDGYRDIVVEALDVIEKLQALNDKRDGTP